MPDSWVQQALTAPECIELNIRLGLIPSTDHAQVLVEMKDPLTSVLRGQASIPHERVANFDKLLAWAVSRATEWVQDQVEPF